MIISWAWITFYVLSIIDLTHEGIMHGKQKKPDKYDFGVSLVARLILIAWIAWIAGGFT